LLAVARAVAALGRAVGTLWRALAALVGGLARAVGRRAATARDLDPEHRRDGAALGVIALGLVSSVAIWRHGAGPVGRSLTALFRLLVGNGAGVLPIVLVGVGIHMLRQMPTPESRGRTLVGTTSLTLAILGLLDLWAASPSTSDGRSHAGGLLGAGVAAPLERGLSAVIAVPLLFLLGAFGVLVVTATPINQLREQIRALLSRKAAATDDMIANSGSVVQLGVGDDPSGDTAQVP
jgi:DNA segregation ATPase FtsK/SpoIIIE, S-DNA-T family